jgi:N-acetylglucosamine-6-sulfatase
VVRTSIRRGGTLALLLLLALGCTDRPNIVIVYTDDQRWDTLEFMPAVQRLAEEGIVFTNSFVTSPVCGPSRASLLTGRLASTQGITLNEGASGQFDPSDTLAVKLQERGYATALFGKYLNGYRDQFPEVPPGWSDWRAFRDAHQDLFGPGSLYVNPMMSWNGVPRRVSGYSTDLIADYALEFIEENADRPFFLLMSFWSAHVPFVPADRHTGVMEGQAPEPPPSLGEEDMTDKPAWLQARVAPGDPTPLWEAAWPSYLEILLSVDEAVAAVRARLEELGLDDDTIIVFTSDNGFLFGEHWHLGKGVPYEESIRVPLVAWNPRLRHREIDELVLNIDVAPTLARLAGTRIDADGRSVLPLIFGFARRWRHFFEIEWEAGFGLPETYRAFRSRALKYVEWESGHRELYFLPADPHETRGARRRPR